MALKYWFEFTDVKTIVHRVEISDATFTGDSTQIYGSCSLDYSETKDTLEPVRGSGLQIDLEANSALTFYDLYSEEERTFSVVYTRANEILFNGWLSPEGIYESLVTDKWIISLDCTDGLGFLKNLSYVEDATGLNFVGKQSLLEIVVNCLKRTKTPQNILTSVKIYYDGLDQTLNTFDNVYFNANRFIKDDKDTIMNCEEVLKSVLEPFGAVITSHKGEWLIYKPNSLVDFSSQIFFAYDADGVALSPIIKTIDFAFDLGSQIDNYYPHHANGNQQKTIKSAIGAYRINYKYGLVKTFLENSDMSSNSDTDIPDFTILEPSKVSFPPDRLGVYVYANNPEIPVLKMTNGIDLVAGDVFTLQTRTSTVTFNNYIIYEVKLVGALNTYYLRTDVLLNNTMIYYEYGCVWETTTQTLSQKSYSSGNTSVSETTYKFIPEELPEDGEVIVTIISPTIPLFPGSPTGNVLLSEFIIEPIVEESNLKGENHTFQRKLKPSSKIKDVKEVYNGDNPSDLYVGAIYETDSTTPTDSWTRQGASETKPLLKIMGEERMKMYSKPLQVYKGDVYGYFNYLSLVTINGLTGKFMPTTYSYNALSNITSLELTEVLNTDILSDVDYQFTFDYGNVVEPTIKG